MKNSILTSSLFCFVIMLALSSCTKEEAVVTHDMLSDESRAEVFLNTHSNLPAIMFSYDVLDTDTKLVTRFLIDNEGQIRTLSDQALRLRTTNRISPSALQTLKDESTIVEDLNVSVEELVQNFNLLRTADRIEYDNSVEQPGPQVLKAMYGYYFDTGTSYTTTTSNECGNESSGTTTSTYYTATGSLFASILLEQKLDENIIQSNQKAKYTASWFNDIASEVQDFLQD